MSLDNGYQYLSVGYAGGDSQRAPLIWDRLVQFFSRIAVNLMLSKEKTFE